MVLKFKNFNNLKYVGGLSQIKNIKDPIKLSANESSLLSITCFREVGDVAVPIAFTKLSFTEALTADLMVIACVMLVLSLLSY